MISGVFGGSFNPFHVGHYAIVKQVMQLNILDRLFVVPAYSNPLKSRCNNVPDEIRWGILEACLKDIPDVRLIDFEFCRPVQSFTWETLDYLKLSFPEDQFKILMGQDTFELFSLWKKRNFILENADLLVFERMQSGEKERKETPFDNNCERIHLDLPEISSTMIREANIETADVNSWIPAKAQEIWRQFLLAREKPSC